MVDGVAEAVSCLRGIECEQWGPTARKSQYAKCDKNVTLFYRVDVDVSRLLWVGKERDYRILSRILRRAHQDAHPYSCMAH
jgi:hypothetical protein